MKKKVNFYFPFSPYEHRKKSSGDYQLTVASLIVVDDAVLKSLSLIDQLWSYESELKNKISFKSIKFKIINNDSYDHNSSIRESDFNTASSTTINDATVNW